MPTGFEMADAERESTDEGAAERPGKRRHELDELLKRIAVHIAEVEQHDATSDSKAVPSGRTAAPAAPVRSEPAVSVAPAPNVPVTAPPVAAPTLAAPPTLAASMAAPSPIPPSMDDHGLLAGLDEHPIADDFPEDASSFMDKPAPRRSAPTIEPPALRSALPAKVSSASLGAGSQHPLTGRQRPSRQQATLDPLPEPRRADATQHPSEPLSTTWNSDASASRAATAMLPADDPWDAETAEALTRTFEAQDAVPPLRSMLELMGGKATHAPAAKPSAISVAGFSAGAVSATSISALALEAVGRQPSAAPDLGNPENDARMLAAAQRVEAALDLLAPRSAIDALGDRFTALESESARFGSELKRLDGIESRLGELSDKLTDEQIVALFGSLVPTAEDLTQFAEDAAGRAAERVLEAYAQEMAAQPPKSPAPESNGQTPVVALREMLGIFMDERRRTDAGTLDALETLQLAMQHMLDRIDHFEGEPTQVTQPAAHRGSTAQFADERRPRPTEEDDHDIDGPDLASPSHEYANQPSSYDNRRSAGGDRRQASHSHFELPARHDFVEDRAQDLDSVPDARGYAEAPERPVERLGARPSTASPSTMTLPTAMPERGFDWEQAAPEHPRQAARPTIEPGANAGLDGPPPVTDRQAYIALARKAAERAKAEAAAQQSGKTGKPSGIRGQVLGATKSKIADGIRPSVLIVTSLAAFLLAGYWFLSGPKLSLSGASPAAIEQTKSAAPARAAPAAPVVGSQPDVESDDKLPAANSPVAPAAPSKISDDAPPAMPQGDQQEANYQAKPSEAYAPGITLEQSATPTSFEQVMQVRERAHLANLSQRAAFNASRSMTVPPGASAIETASVDPAPVTAPPQQQRQLTLPPAILGPLSLRLAAAKGDPSAQLEIASRFAEGKGGVKQNYPEAIVWYQRAAAQGEAISQYRLATLFERGIGVARDQSQARIWYQQAADQGNLKAMHNLAVLTTNAPEGASPDYATAAKLFTKAADQGLADSQYNLGVLYESGLGVAKDHVAAYKWYSLAAKRGDQEAARRRDQLIARLPTETVQSGDKLIAAWKLTRPNPMANDARVAGDGWKRRTAKAN